MMIRPHPPGRFFADDFREMQMTALRKSSLTGRLGRRSLPTRVVCLALVLVAGPAETCRAADEKALPSDLALLPANGAGFVSIRVGKIATGTLGKAFLAELRKEAGNVASEMEKEFGVPLADIERLTIIPPGLLIVRTAKPYDREKVLDAVAPQSRRERFGDKSFMRDDNRGVDVYLLDERVFVKAPKNDLVWLWERPAARVAAASLAEALQAASQNHDIVAGMNPPGLVKFVMLERRQAMRAPPALIAKPAPKSTSPGVLPKNPCAEQEADGGNVAITDGEMTEWLRQLPPFALPYKPLLQAHLGILVADLAEQSQLQLRLTFPNKDIAKDGETAVRTGLYVLRELLPQVTREMPMAPELARGLEPTLRAMQAALKNAEISNEGSVVTATARLRIDPAVFGTAALQMRRSADQMRGMNDLKQIVLAMHNYENAYGALPPATIYSKDGKPLLSWRVAILPFIEEEALYRQFKLDEPWDSPNNKPLLAKMPKLYAPARGRTKEPHSTPYQVFTGPLAPFQLTPDGSAPFGAKGPRLTQFVDGTSNTLLVVEAAESVSWTKPEDLAYDDKKPVPKLGAAFRGGFLAAFADGAVRFLPGTLDEQTLRALIMPADGMVIDWDKIEGKQARPGPNKGTPKAVPLPPDGRGNEEKVPRKVP
jgi:hypothetical protein